MFVRTWGVRYGMGLLFLGMITLGILAALYPGSGAWANGLELSAFLGDFRSAGRRDVRLAAPADSPL